jgi:signal transduction histidine kinase
VNAAKLTADVVNVFAPRCEDAGITLRCSVDPQTPGIRGDTVRLKVVLSNLLSNALKYTPSGGEIAIDVGTASWSGPARSSAPRGVPADPPTSRAVCLTVTDTGPGVPAEYRELIFDKFFRVEHYQPRKEEQGARGAGIGLYLSRRVIEAHGGAIHCKAPPSGRGTKMTILLPVAEA